MILSDCETSVDLLNNEAIAMTIIELLRERPGTPITIGVHGDWGAGKSSVLEMIQAGLAGQEDTLCLKFNGWRFQGFEDAKIVLLEGIVDALVEARPALSKAADVAKGIFRRIDWLKLAKRAGGIAWAATAGLPTLEQIGAVLARLPGAADPSSLVTRENIEKVAAEISASLRTEDPKQVPSEIRAFRKQFEELLDAAGVRQLVVLVDDLDRCLPDTAVETLEAIRLFVLTNRTAFVIAADEGMIEYSVRGHFPDLPEASGPFSYARNYLEKLIQVPFRIPALGVTETRAYVILLLIGAELGEDDATFARLIGVARDALKCPWKSGGLDAAAIETAFSKSPPAAVQEALVLGEQLGPVLAHGTAGNPRQIKRFLNSLLLRQRTASALGFGDEIKARVLAKLMLAERFQPRLFEQVARASAGSAQGACAELALLEASVSGDATDSPKSRKGTGGRQSDDLPPLVQEWLDNETVRAWASVQPPIGAEDLRPYIFVTKDRRSYFGSVSTLGHLESLVERLYGPRIAVQALEPELKRLAPAETEQLFAVLRARIIGQEKFDRQPGGIDGIHALLRVNPALEGRLLDLLEGLPKERLGAWVVTGWESAIQTPSGVARFGELLKQWAEAATNKPLALAAESVLKVQKLK